MGVVDRRGALRTGGRSGREVGQEPRRTLAAQPHTAATVVEAEDPVELPAGELGPQRQHGRGGGTAGVRVDPETLVLEVAVRLGRCGIAGPAGSTRNPGRNSGRFDIGSPLPAGSSRPCSSSDPAACYPPLSTTPPVVASGRPGASASSSQPRRVRLGSAPIDRTALASMGPAAWMTDKCFLALVNAV